MFKLDHQKCGQFNLHPKKITLNIPTRNGNNSSYAFNCPVCKTRVTISITDRIAKLLLNAPIRVNLTNPITTDEITQFIDQIDIAL